jgi:hypothetical protein
VKESLDAVWRIQVEFSACLSESCSVLCCGEDGDVEDLACGMVVRDKSVGGSFASVLACWRAGVLKVGGWVLPVMEGAENVLARSSFCVVATTLGNS